MSTIPELFGSLVFDDKVMRARLSSDVYHSLRDTINKGKKLDLSVANAVAAAMCEWAVENGATHFTHWFQPLTGITAEKHDSFITPAPDSQASPPAVCAPPLKPEDIPPGTRPPMLLSRKRPSASRRLSAPTGARRWTRRPRCCAAWRR